MNSLWASLRGLLLDNLGTKVLALVVALGVQVVVHRDTVREAELSARLRLGGVPAGQVFVGAPPETAKLRLRGRRVALAELKGINNLEIPVDISGYRDGDRLVIDPRAIERSLPVRALEVGGIDPPAIDVRLEALQTKMVPVEATYAGEPGPGFRANPKQALVEPAQVQISGPASALARATVVRTLPVDLGYAEKEFAATVRLQSLGAALLVAKPDEVRVTVKLEETDMTRTLVGVPVMMRNCPSGAQCSIDPPEIALRLEGPGQAVRRMVAKPIDSLAYVDFAQAPAAVDGQLKIATAASRGVSLTPMPAVAKFSVVRNGSPPPAEVRDRPDAAPR